MKIEGRIKVIKPIETVGTNGFRKRDVVVTTDEQYPQQICVQFIQDKCDLLDSFAIDQIVTIDINLRGREWINPQGEAIYFNTIQGWRIAERQTQTQAPPQQQTPQYGHPPVEGAEGEPDNLPF